MSKKSISYQYILFFIVASTLAAVEVELEPIMRGGEEIAYPIPLLIPAELPSYPWEVKAQPHLRPIQKENLQCKGRKTRPAKLLANGESHNDCDGSLDHGLPVNIPPILLTLLNWVQEKTGSEVVITSGHRCPRHQTYLNASPKAQSTKHQVGAEVNFYVRGWETRPEEIVTILFDYYGAAPKKWDKETDVKTTPWYNEEVFVKLYKKDEGRDEDNDHPYPFIDLQVRTSQYTWKGSQEYFR